MYKKLEVVGNTIRAWGGKDRTYFHNCPVGDSHVLVEQLWKIYEEEGKVSRLDLKREIGHLVLSRHKLFSSGHEYKIDIVFDLLIQKGFLKRNGLKKKEKGKGRSPHGFVFTVDKSKLDKWLNQQLSGSH